MSEKSNFSKVHEKLTIQVEKYIQAILEEYDKFIPVYQKNLLVNIKDYNRIIKIWDYGSMNGYASAAGISMPLCADKLLGLASKIPGFGINKKHKCYDENNLIINNNTFMNYILHVFISGTTTEEYFEDLLLHETMHFCGSGGSSALMEGITELLTRKIALKRGFRTSGCGYPKEVAIAYQLQNILGEDIVNQIVFLNNKRDTLMYLESMLGKEAANFYREISAAMEYEFQEKYYKDMDSYNGIRGMLKKVENYKKINYEKVYLLMDHYVAKQNSKLHK